MLLGDLIYNDDFDVNCNFAVYQVKRGDGKTWHDIAPVWDTTKNGWSKPPCALLDKKIAYITTDFERHNIVIEIEEDN